MKLTIKAAFVDAIEMLEHRRKWLKELPNKTKEVFQDLEELTKEDLINLLQSIDSYRFSECHIIYTRPLNKEELQKEKDFYKVGICSDIRRLKKWCENSEEDKNQILRYLEKYNIKVEEIQ